LPAVKVYVVVTTGLTVLVPVTASTAPIPWSMLTEVASATVQVSVELPPSLMDAGAAVKLVTTGFVFRMTAVSAVVEPEAFIAVIM